MIEKMRSGWLWFDNDKGKTLEQKVTNAADKFKAKFGYSPTLCYVHPGAMTAEETMVSGVEVCTARHILPHHFWLGELVKAGV